MNKPQKTGVVKHWYIQPTKYKAGTNHPVGAYDKPNANVSIKRYLLS